MFLTITKYFIILISFLANKFEYKSKSKDRKKLKKITCYVNNDFITITIMCRDCIQLKLLIITCMHTLYNVN